MKGIVGSLLDSELTTYGSNKINYKTTARISTAEEETFKKEEKIVKTFSFGQF